MHSQDITHPFNTDASFTIVSGLPAVNYYDNGGPGCDITGSGAYLNNSNASAVLCPDVMGQPVTIEFLEVDIETRTNPVCWDFLNVYNGNSTAATQLFTGCGEEGFPVCVGGFAGDGSDGGSIEGGPNDIHGSNVALPLLPVNNIFTSTDATGCLTVEFTSDGSVDQGGWTALVSAPAVAGVCTFTIDCPADLTIMAGDPIPAAPASEAEFTAAGGVITGSAACGGFTVTSVDSPVTGDICTGSNLMRTFTVSQAADPANSMTCTQQINISPQAAPVIVAPADVSANCIADVDINPANAMVTSADPNVMVTAAVTSFVGSPECPGSSAIVTYTATDNCGNIATATQTINNSTPAGTGGPVITAFPPTDTVDCIVNLIPNFNLVEATTSCGGPFTVTASEPVLISGSALCNGARYSSTYTVTDDCGRTTTQDRICLLQNDGPEFVCPAQYCIIECPQDDAELQAKFDAYAALATVNTSCVGQAVTITNTFNPNFFINQNCNNAGPFAIPNTQRYQVVTFRATTCSGTTSCTAVVAVVDNTPPTIQGSLAAGTAACNDDVQAAFDAFVQNRLTQLDATDECSVANGNDNNDLIFSASPATPNTVCEGGVAITPVTFTVTDPCGNASSVVANFLITNPDGPIVAALPNRTVECGMPIVFDTPVASNACGAITITFEDTDGGPVSCPAVSSTTRTFTVSDACGGSTTVQQTISEVDTQAPVAPAAPADVTVSCASDLPAPVMLTATDNCVGPITVGPTPVVTPGACDDQFVMVRTWTFDDGCNVSSVSQTITVNDDVAPVFTVVPAGMSGECMGTIMEFGEAEATDNCNGAVTITFVDDTSNAGTCGMSVTRTWTATDACGNTSTASATMSTGDTEAPVASNIPMDMTIDCEATPVFGMPTFTDNCADDVTVVMTDSTTPGDCDAEVVMTRTWTATDDCDNTTVISQTITMEDNDGPVFVSVPGGVFECDGNFDDPVVTDNCSSFDITFVDDSNGSGCNETITRTYTATDACGNVTTATATLTINDSEAPVFTNVPGTLDVDCDEIPEFTPPTAVDNCGDITLTFVETESGELCDEGFSRKRVWTATDNCGNTATVETAIWVNKDDTPPVFTNVPETLDVNCDEVPEFTAPTVEDDCSDVTLTFVETESGELCDEGFSRKRVWTATDGCGNTATVETAIWVNKDNTPPVFTFVPPTDQMISCDEFPPTFGDVVVEDDCSGVTVTFEDDFVFGDENSCDNGESFDYRRRWTATDGCGNTSRAEQKFWVMPGAVTATISGTLMTEELEMTDNVMMSLENSSATNLNQLSTDGNFMFPVELNQNYTLTPERDDDPLNGVSTYDLVLLGRHLLEVETLDSPYKLIAADVNNSGGVTSLDMIALRRLILHIDESIDNNTSWRFVESEYIFADPTNPFATTFPEVSNFNGVTQSQIADFVAIKIGDLNASATPNHLAAGDTRSADGDLIFQLDDANLSAGEQYEVAFKARDFAAVQGYQYTLNLAGLELVDVQAGALRGLTADNFGMTNLDRGILTTSWNSQNGLTIVDDEVLFTLIVKATEAVKLSGALRLGSDLTTAEGYSETSDKLAVSLRFGEEGTIGAEAFTLYQNRPNPFGAETTISFNLPAAMDATLTIYDVSGRVLKQVTRNYAAGYNEELIERNELSAAGVLYYQLETATETATKKMILINK